MAGNTSPIFTRQGKIGSCFIGTAMSDYVGNTANTKEVFSGDDTNGSFIERIRFKARGTSGQSVARIFINSGGINTSFGSAPSAPSGTPSASGGTVLSGTYYAKIVAIGPNGSRSPLGSESAGVTVTGPTGSVAWSWTAVAGAVSYEIYIADSAGAQVRYFTSVTNSYSQTGMWQTGSYKDPNNGNMVLFGEMQIPAINISSTLATPDMDYPMNIVLPPGTEVYVGISTSNIGNGFTVTAIGGIY